jgi:hypothetical protein
VWVGCPASEAPPECTIDSLELERQGHTLAKSSRPLDIPTGKTKGIVATVPKSDRADVRHAAPFNVSVTARGKDALGNKGAPDADLKLMAFGH